MSKRSSRRPKLCPVSLVSVRLIGVVTALAAAVPVHGAPPAAVGARARGPRVDIVCPVAPTPVPNRGVRSLVYELHITNFEARTVVLKEVQVFADDGRSAPLAVFSGARLSGMMSGVGMHTDEDASAIASGRRAIVFFWIDLGAEAAAPRQLHHRLEFAGETSNALAAGETTLEDYPVAVGQEPPPLFVPPFEGGVWLAGGLSSGSDHRRTVVALDGHARQPERFAIDWVKVGPNGNSYHDAPERNENWWGYGEPIHAVADGEVTAVVDGIAENTARTLPKEVNINNIAGNYVVVRIADRRYVTYAHLQPGSIAVRPGQRVRAHDVLARLGNTGNATSPHMHMQLSDGETVLGSEGLPFVFDRFVDLGPGSEYELDKHVTVPRQRSIPAGDAVIDLTR